MIIIRLTDNEIRDITRLLEEGKPISDKYRFLIFEDKRQVELVWNGKTNEISNVVLPFQIIEQVDEPRKAGIVNDKQANLFSFDVDKRGRQLEGWTNKLIWGDNKLILSSLKNGPLRDEIEAEGGIKLIYIDPPFDVGADFNMKIKIENESFTKEAGVLEEIAYRDTWGKGADSFIAMMYERLALMKDLLAEDGSIFVHCDWRVNYYLRHILDEIFGKDNFASEIIFKRTAGHHLAKGLDAMTDTILYYTKSDNCVFNQQYQNLTQEELDDKFPYTEAETGRRYNHEKLEQSSNAYSIGEIRVIQGKKVTTNVGWRWTQKTFDERLKENPYLIHWTKQGRPRYKNYAENYKGRKIGNLWDDIQLISSNSSEAVGYPTQKPQDLLRRVILQSSNEGDLVADFFCGSGTTLAVSEKLGRKWIGTDLGKFAIHTARKRMIDVQRSIKESGNDYRAFEILNLGKYERQHYVGVNTNLRIEDQEKMLAEKQEEFIELILNAYKAERVKGFNTFHGKRSSRMVVVGPVNLPVSRLYVEEIINECTEKKITKVDVLGFEFEMGLFPDIQETAKKSGVDLTLKHIPNEVFDKRAVEKNQVKFYDAAYIEVKSLLNGNNVAIELTDFSVFYNQDQEIEQNLKNNSSKIILENGQIIKVSKDKDGHSKRTKVTKKWTDWIDYWSVDFDFESKEEIIRIKNEKDEIVQKWTGNYVFENEWQTFRTNDNRELELISSFHKIKPGKTKIAVKVVDIFGNDTMKVIEVEVGGK